MNFAGILGLVILFLVGVAVVSVAAAAVINHGLTRYFLLKRRYLEELARAGLSGLGPTQLN